MRVDSLQDILQPLEGAASSFVFLWPRLRFCLTYDDGFSAGHDRSPLAQKWKVGPHTCHAL